MEEENNSLYRYKYENGEQKETTDTFDSVENQRFYDSYKKICFFR